MAEEERKTVRQMMEEYLKENGFDGLYNENGDCGCVIGDLMCCESEGIENCLGGYKIECNHDREDGEGCTFCISANKGEKECPNGGE